MIKKEQVVNLLKSMLNDENEQYITQFVDKISNVDEKQWKKILETKKIETLQDAQKFIVNAIENQKNTNFEELNELVSFGYFDTTIHIHVLPKDVHSLLSKKGLEKSEYLLIDALEKIQTMLQEDERFKNVDQVYAVSGIIRKPISSLFENLDFDVKTMKSELARNDQELSKFYEMFKDKKYIGRAKLFKEKLLSDDWNIRKEKRKAQILANNKDLKTRKNKEIKKIDFCKDLEQVYSIEDAGRNTEKREQIEKEIGVENTINEKNIII